MTRAPPRWLSGKESACTAGDMGSIPGPGRSLAEGNGNPLQFLAWEIPWTEESGRLQSMESQRVGDHLVTKQQQGPSGITYMTLSSCCPSSPLTFLHPLLLLVFFLPVLPSSSAEASMLMLAPLEIACPLPLSWGMLSPSLITIPHGVKATGTHQSRLQDVHTVVGHIQRTAAWPCPHPAWPFCFRQENAVRATLAPSASLAQGNLRTSASEMGSAWMEPMAQARVSVGGASAGRPVRPALRASTACTATKVRTPPPAAGSPSQPEMQEERV